MSPGQTTLCALCIAAAGATVLFERHLIAAHSERVRASAAEKVRLEQHLSQLRAEIGTAAQLANEAESAQREPVRTTGGELPDALSTESAAWLRRYHHLKQLLADQPRHRIPEMDLLSDRELLMQARGASFDTEDGTRRALGATRTAAKAKFARQLSQAMQLYRKANDGKLPTDIAALAPFLEPPLTAAHLGRWTVVTGPAATPANFIAELAPVDADYDSRVRIQTSGGSSIQSPPIAWLPDLEPRARQAHEAFSRANPGRAWPGYDALLPYFDPPLDFATADKLRRFEHERRKR